MDTGNECVWVLERDTLTLYLDLDDVSVLQCRASTRSHTT